MGPTVKKKTEEIVSRVSKLNALVEYSPGLIASKTIFDKKSASVDVFAFDKFQGIVAHTLPYDALFFVFDGEAEVCVSGKSYVVRTGEMIVFPANKPHSISAKSKFKMLLLSLKE
jgi:quercetin dioxygenase-like cupin family protein